MGNSQSSCSGSSSSADAQANVEQIIQSDAVVVFAKVSCPYCAATKRLLRKKGVKYTAINVDVTKGGTAMHSALKQMTGHRTVPSIFIGQKHIGGNSEIQSINKTGELDHLLRDARAI